MKSTLQNDYLRVMLAHHLQHFASGTRIMTTPELLFVYQTQDPPAASLLCRKRKRASSSSSSHNKHSARLARRTPVCGWFRWNETSFGSLPGREAQRCPHASAVPRVLLFSVVLEWGVIRLAAGISRSASSGSVDDSGSWARREGCSGDGMIVERLDDDRRRT